MPQLLVRDIEVSVVKKLRRRAAADGVSVEEAHRRVLREALVGVTPGPVDNFLDYLRAIPQAGATEFPRAKDGPREVSL
jgi:plasmid stability protein